MAEKPNHFEKGDGHPKRIVNQQSIHIHTTQTNTQANQWFGAREFGILSRLVSRLPEVVTANAGEVFHHVVTVIRVARSIDRHQSIFAGSTYYV